MAKNFTNVSEFKAFLRNTLIPDLRAEGTDFTANDLESLIEFLEGATSVGGDSREEFVKYLELTLIPELKESALHSMAQDFQDGLDFLNEKFPKESKKMERLTEMKLKRELTKTEIVLVTSILLAVEDIARSTTDTIWRGKMETTIEYLLKTLDEIGIFETSILKDYFVHINYDQYIQDLISNILS